MFWIIIILRLHVFQAGQLINMLVAWTQLIITIEKRQKRKNNQERHGMVAQSDSPDWVEGVGRTLSRPPPPPPGSAIILIYY